MSPMINGCVSVGTTSALPPARRTNSASHSAAAFTSPDRSASALTLGMRISSASSSNQGSATAAESRQMEEGPRSAWALFTPSVLRHVAKCDRVGERAQLLQALVLDLADPLTRHVERAADLVQRARVLAVEAVAELEDAPLAEAQRPQHALERRLADLDLGGLFGKRLGLVGEEVPELGLLFVADRLLQRDRRLRAAPDLLDLVRAELDVPADLPRGRLPAELGAPLPLRADDLVQLLDDVHRHADRPGLVRQGAGDGLADPPGGVRRELEALAVVELLGRAHEPDRPLLDEIEEGQALVAVPLGDRDDEAQVRLDHLLLRFMLAALDALRELDLLGGGEKVDLADVLQEELQRVGRDLARRLRLLLLLVVPVLHDLDLQLLERVVEVVDLRGVEIELAERRADLLGAERPRRAAGFQQPLRFVRLEHLGDARRLGPLPLLPHYGSSSGLVAVRTHPIRGCGTLSWVPDGRHRPNGSFFAQRVPTFRKASRYLAASCPSGEFGASARAFSSSS